MQEKKRTISLGVLFWIATILLILVVFLFNRQNIEESLENTQFIEVIQQKFGANLADNPPSETSTNGQANQSEEVENKPLLILPENPNSESPKEIDKETIAVSETNLDESSSDSTSDTESQDPTKKPPSNNEAPVISEPPSTENQAKGRDFSINLVQVLADGKIALTSIIRHIEFENSPLRETLNQLISEPSENDNFLNLIPANTVLNSVWIQNGIAYVDLSEEFLFNPNGREGYQLQVQQIIRTATQFDTVDAVQLLIDGEAIDFLGGDGLFIGQPLKPSDQL